MSYSQSGLIEAVDYNTFAQGGASVNHAVANINTVWGVGQGDKGYGQSSVLSPVSASTSTVTATQWSTMISRLNSILTHQSGSGSGLTLPTTGATIAYLSTLSSSVSTAYSNRLTAASNGTDITGSAFSSNWTVNSLNAQPTTNQVVRTATFASADAARYFFNAGGKLVLTMSASNTRGNSKGNDWVSLIGTKVASHTFSQGSNARGGTGGTVSTSNTAIGYWGLTTGNQSMLKLTSASGAADYGGNYIELSVKSNHGSIPQGSNSDKGYIITFTIDMNDVAGDTNTAPGGWAGVGTAPSQGDYDDELNLAISTNITVRPPETTNLSNTWGTVTIS